MSKSPRRLVPHVILIAIVIAALAAAGELARALPLPNEPDDFNSPGFVVRHAWVKFGFLFGRMFRGDLNRAQQDTLVARFFELNRSIEREEQQAGDSTTPAATVAANEHDLTALRAERARIENTVEVMLEGRLTHVIREAGLTRRVGGDIVWPPVDIEFQDPPPVLVESPRSKIEIESQTLLEGDLPIEKVQRIEAAAERDGRTSALVVHISGIAMYPAIIPESSDYRETLRDIAHEWTHHYLFFTPLGRRYFESGKLTTLNETLADMVGQELGDRMLKEYALSAHASSVERSAPEAPSPKVDFTRVMRDLHRKVEALLRDRRIEEAERDMEQIREYLAANGYYIRRLNQAYFAFHGSYADTAGSIDPIGPKLETLRKDSPSLEAFVHTAQEFTSEADLDRALTPYARRDQAGAGATP